MTRLEQYLNVVDYFEKKCASWGERDFLFENENAHGVSYQALNHAVKRTAIVLKENGLQAGDRVILFMDNSIAAIQLFFATIWNGVIPIIVPENKNSNQLEQIIIQANPSAFLLPDCHLSSLDNQWDIVVYPFSRIAAQANIAGSNVIETEAMMIEPRQSELNDCAYMMFTSGSTGIPKKVEVSHLNLLAETQSMADAYAFEKNDRHLCVLPIYHVSGLYRGILLPFHSGGVIRLMPGFKVEQFWQIIHDEKITFVQVVPSILKTLLIHKELFIDAVCQSLKCIGSASAPHPVELLEAFQSTFGIYVLQGYGMTEATCGITLQPLEKQLYRPGSVGLPLSVNHIQVLDDNDNPLPNGESGRIVISGENIARWNDPNQQAADPKPGVLDSGDIGYVDSEGFVWLQARKSDVIKRGGLRMSTTEIEAEISCVFPNYHIAVIGVPHELLGQDVVAFVSHQEPEVTRRDMLKAMKGHVESQKIPSEIIFLETIPTIGVGKVDKKRLLDIYQEMKTERVKERS